MNNCITCKKNNKGDNWRNCKLKCHYKYEQRKKDEICKLQEKNKQMQERLNNCEKFFNELGELLNEEVGNAYWTQTILHKIKNLKQQFEIDKNQINYFIEENEKQKEQIKQLEDFIKSDGEISHINHEYTYKLKQVLQEVKSIAKGVRSYLEVPAPRDVRFEMDRILDLITKVQESEEK